MVIAANAGRYPVSAQCEILGVPRSTYYAMRGRAEPAETPDPAAEEVAAVFEESRGRYGARKIKASLARRGIVLSRRRIGRIMKGKGLTSAYADAKFKPSRSSAGEADVPDIVNRGFDGRAPRTHVVSAIDELLDVFEIKRSPSAKGFPYDNSVDEPANKILKTEFVYRERFSTLRELQAKLSDYVNRCNNFRLHSTLGYMSPVEVRLAG